MPIDSRKMKLTLDEYTNGDRPWGELLLKGTARLHGVLRIEEGPAGIYWFSPVPALVEKQEAPLHHELGTLEFDDEDAFGKQLHVPRELQNGGCLEADVVIEVRDIHVVMGDGDQAGAVAVHNRVIEQNNYRRCSN